MTKSLFGWIAGYICPLYGQKPMIMMVEVEGIIKKLFSYITFEKLLYKEEVNVYADAF